MSASMVYHWILEKGRGMFRWFAGDDLGVALPLVRRARLRRGLEGRRGEAKDHAERADVDGRLRQPQSSGDRACSTTCGPRPWCSKTRKGTRVAIVTLDLVGIGPDLADPICDELQAKYQTAALARRDLLLAHAQRTGGGSQSAARCTTTRSTTHRQQLIDRYAAELKAKIVELVGRADRRLAPSQISWGQGTATFAVNRRNNKEPDAASLRAAGQLVGPVDHDVPVLQDRRRRRQS